jgi:molybdopterin molybdotransferase
MDGIAVNYNAFSTGQNRFLIEKTLAAGEHQYALKDQSRCVEIMTGAVLPFGCDTVIPYEDMDIEAGEAIVNVIPRSGMNIHWQGTDRKAGDIIVAQGTSIEVPEIGVAATVGRALLTVFKVPAICLVSTGDELVPVEEIPEPHQIRSSNVHALKASLSCYDSPIVLEHLPDEKETVERTVQELLQKYQIIIFIGGSSMGKFDFLPDALSSAGVREHFYKVRQRPGKPLWFGSLGNHFVFALPGNPVSCFLCLEKYFKYWLNNSLGLAYKEESAQLNADFTFEPDLTYFLQVGLKSEDGVVTASPVQGGGSGDHANLAGADAFLELPHQRSYFSKGESFNLVKFRR